MFGSFFTLLGPNGLYWGLGRVQKLFWGLLISTNNFSEFCSISALSCSFEFLVVVVVVGGVPSNYFVSTQLQLWLLLLLGFDSFLTGLLCHV